MAKKNAKAKKPLAPEILSELLELVYPIQYKWGYVLENVMRSDDLSRIQVAILWLIRCEGDAGRTMRRRDIQRFLTAWFDAGNSTITKAVRPMTRSPLNLVRVVEYPLSGREKNIVLTAKGEQFFEQMLKRCRAFFEPIAAQIGDEDIREGIRYLKKWLSSVEALSIPVFPKNALISAGKRTTASEGGSAQRVKKSRDRNVRKISA
jgi:DNA-binding MarR family transcriptional regulator